MARLHARHLRDTLEVVWQTPGAQDPETLETGAPTEVISWCGKCSLQPNRKTPSPASVTGGVAQEQPEFLIYAPFCALSQENGFIPRVNGKDYRLVRPAQNVGGQGSYWLLGVNGNR